MKIFKKAYNRISISISSKIIIAITFLIFCLVSSLIYYFYENSYNNLKREFSTSLLNIVQTASINIKGEDHDKIHSLDDVSKKPFQKISSYLKQVMVLNNLSPETLYTFKIDENKELMWCVMLHKKPFVGEMYKQTEYTKKIIQKVLQGKAQTTDIYEDQHGHWISAYAPIKDKNNKVVGILEADYRIEKFLSQLKNNMYVILKKASFIFILGFILILFVTKTIVNPIKILTEAASRIESGNYDLDLAMNRKDELGDLQKSFTKMAASLAERFHMLKYISPHTLDMIQKALKNEINEKGEYKNVVIFFSDIRGFTKFSSTRTPEVVIDMLNTMLGLQTDLITSNGGHIDKFVGDEIVAIFDTPNAVIDAIYVATKIHNSINALNTANINNAQLQVGIGISVGEVIFGNIGSQDRKDFTIIGSEVNLTARLCSYANAGQIAISKSAYIKVQNHEDIHKYNIEHKGDINLKGFAEPIDIYLVDQNKKS